MRKVIAAIIFVLIPVLFACANHPSLNGSFYQAPIPKANIRKTLYIDDQFSDWEKGRIEAAAESWNCSTNKMVGFQVKRHLKPEDIYFINAEDSVLVEKADITNPLIREMDEEISGEDEGLITLGLYNEREGRVPVIYLVDDRIAYNEFFEVAAHEEGHALGLVHIDNTDAIMYHRADKGAKHITKNDLKEFCDVYGCDANKMNACWDDNE